MKRVLLALCLVTALSAVFSVGPYIHRICAAEAEWEVILCNPLLRHLEMESTWEAAKAVGVTGIEITVGSDLVCNNLFVGKKTPYMIDMPESARRIRQDSQKYGLKLPVICAPIRVRFATPYAGAPAWAAKVIECAPHLGATLVYFPIVTDNFTKPTVDDETFIQRSILLLKDLVSHGERSGVTVTFENLSVYWNRPEITRKVLAAFTSRQVNLCLDPTNLYWYGHPLTKIYDIVQEFAPRTKHLHAKNVSHPADKRDSARPPGWQYGKNSVPVAEGDLNFERIMRMLDRAGYAGYVSIEDDSLPHFPKDQRVDVLRRDVQYLRGIISRLK